MKMWKKIIRFSDLSRVSSQRRHRFQWFT